MKNISNSEKMVVINGVSVPMSKAEGRIKALANGRRIKDEKDASLAATRREETEQMRKAGWADSEITQYFLSRENEEARSHGFIQPTPRTYRAPKVPFVGGGVMFH